MTGRMEEYGFVGLGVMGGPMAGHVLSKGLPLTVWARTASKAEDLGRRGAKVVPRLADLGAACGVVALCVTGTEDVVGCCEVLAGAMKPGGVVVDHSTIAPSGVRRVQALLGERGIGFVDAPITGGSMGAQNGTLTAFCGGGPHDIERVRPLLDAYCRRAERVGGSGSGQLTKVANQIAVGGALLALCESLAFAEMAGLDVGLTRELLAGGAAGSWAFENYGPKILARDWSPGFTVKNQNKDFRYCLEAAAEVGAQVPATDLAHRLLVEMEDAGRGGDTTAALFEWLLGERDRR